MIVDGKVGLGTSAPKKQLHLFQPIDMAATDTVMLNLHRDVDETALNQAPSKGVTALGFTQTSHADAPTKALVGYKSQKGAYGAGGDLVFAISAKGDLSEVDSHADRVMTLTAGGNVGVGTPDPAQ